MKRFLFFGVVVTIVCTLPAIGSLYAAVPNAVNYQGQYTEYGQPITGIRTMSFTIFDASSNGNQVWTSGAQSVQVTNGIFSYTLNPGVDMRAQSTGVLYLEINVNGKTLSPREQLTSNWYALHASDAENISSTNTINFMIGASTIAMVTGTGIHLATGGIQFADTTIMTTAGAGSAVSIYNSTDAVVDADAGAHGTGNVLLEIAGSPKLTVANAGNVVISSGLAVNGRIMDKTGFVMPVGTVLPYAGSIAPQGWLLCDGSSKLTASYPDLFGVIGYTFGGSGGNFNVPNLQNNFPIGAGTFAIGNTGGSTSITAAELPPHTHSGSGDTGAESQGHTHGMDHTHTYSGTTSNGNNNGGQGLSAGGFYGYADNPHTHTYSGTTSDATNTSGSVITGGESQAHTHHYSFTTDNGPGINSAYYQPYIALNYIIKY